MKQIKFAFATLATVLCIGAYASNQEQKDPQLTQGYVTANCPQPGNMVCGNDDGRASEEISQLDEHGNIVITNAGDFVSKQ